MLRPSVRWLPPAGLLLFVAGLSLRPMAESDLFFHLKVGQEILTRHALPGRNLFSFTYPDYPDLDTSWLAEVGGALVYARAGFPGVVVAKTIVLVIAFAGAYALCRRRGAGSAASALALAAAAFVGHDRFVERPHIFSLLGEVATLAAIDTLATRRGRPAGRAAAVFLAIVVVWANLHAGVFLAPVLVGAAALAALATGAGSAGRRLLLVAALAAAATLVTPIGLGLVRYLRLHLAIPALHPIDEFRSPTWISDAPLFVYAAAFLALVPALGLAGPRAARATWLLALAPVIPVGALALHSVRFGADFALCGAPLLAVALSALVGRLPAALGTLIRPPLPAVATGALLAGFAVAPRVGAAAPLQAGIGLDTGELPLAAIAFVNDNGLRERMYNDFEIGSYLLFEPTGGYPRHRVFVDPRLPAYPLEMHRLLGRADLSRQDWTAAMDHYGVETALLAYAGINRRVAWWDPARWALVFRGGDARVFVRRLPRFRALIAAREIPATFTFTVEDGAQTVPLVARPADTPVTDCSWNRRLGDLMFDLDGVLSERARGAYDRALAAPAGCLARDDEAHLGAWLGAVDLAGGRASAALPLLERALAAGDQALSTLTDRAVALEALGRRADAAAAWKLVADRAAGTPLGDRARARAGRLASSSP